MELGADFKIQGIKKLSVYEHETLHWVAGYMTAQAQNNKSDVVLNVNADNMNTLLMGIEWMDKEIPE